MPKHYQMPDAKWHKCPPFDKAMAEYFGPFYGPAVTDIQLRLDTKQWWMHNGEYATGPIHYCPFCGEDLDAYASNA